MRIVFLGTGDIALPTFQALVESRHEVILLVTQPDKPVGRHQILTPPEIKTLAEKHHVQVFQPENLRKKEEREKISALAPEVIVVMAYGQILTDNLISSASHACINLHASLLPKYRGAACIQAAIDHGDLATGISVMHVVKQLDAGDVILQKELLISQTDTAESIHDALAALAPHALLEALDLLEKNQAPRLPQDPALVTHVGKLLRDDGKIDWHMSAEIISRRIRAYHSWPGTFTLTSEGTRMKIFPQTEILTENILSIGETKLLQGKIHVGCGTGTLILSDIQAEGSKKMPAESYARRQQGFPQFL